MKKIIFWILSILLISPVFSVDIRLISNNNQISFENISNSTNLTYLQTNYNTLTFWNDPNVYHTFLSIYDEWSVLSYPYKFYVSDFTWYSYNLNINNSVFSQSSNNQYIWDSKIWWYWLLSISKNWYFYDPDTLQLFYSRYTDWDYSWNNPLISFWNNINTWVRTYLNNSYLRVFYSDNFNWYSDTLTPWVNTQKSTPFNYELFILWSNFFNTKYYSVLLPWRFNGTFYTPNYSYWFSYVNALTWYTWNTLKFYTVFPFFDYEFTSTWVYSVPSWWYTNQFYMFRFDWLSAWSDFSHLAVIWKCNSYFCNGTWLYSDMLYSEYYCNWLSLNESTKYINFSEKCTLINWWIIKNILPFTNSTWVVNISFVTNNFLSNILSYFNSPQINWVKWNIVYPQDYTYNWFWNFYINSNKLCYKVASYYRYYFSSFNDVCYNIVSTSNWVIPDFLSNYNNTYSDPVDPVPSEPLTTWSVVDVLDSICKTAIVKPPYCQNWWLVDLSWDLEGMWYVDLSWNLVYTVIGTDPNNLWSFDLVPNWSWWFDVICTDDLFWCTLSDNLWLSWVIIWWSSWFMLPIDYYDKFFTQTWYWAKCPYPYTDINVWLHSKFLNKVWNILGFDIFLPVNCFIAAFSHWKNYKFLSDVSLGTNPLMWQIQWFDDPRVYLYRFFDFLLSFALLVFLLKLYHLLN